MAALRRRDADVRGRPQFDLGHQEQVAEVLEDDAEVMSDAQLAQLLTDEPPEIQAEIISINTDARHRALQVALLVPFVAGILGLLNSSRMNRHPGLVPSGAQTAAAT
jgi:hypothetical protein